MDVDVAIARSLWVVALVGLAAGCATPKAAEPRGTWQPVHQFSDAPRVIPLHRAYVYQVHPSDGTLQALLQRWARDAGLTVAYGHADDYTLHVPLAQLRTTRLDDAVSALSRAYAAYGVTIAADGGRIVVAPVHRDGVPTDGEG